MKYDFLVIGGGAAGMMAAGHAAELGLSACLVEKGARLGRKLRITGKGRCNVTNSCSVQEVVAAVPSNGRFLYGAVSAFPPQEVMAFFQGLGVPLKTERGNRVFPVSDHASDVVEALESWLRGNGCQVRAGAAVSSLLLREGRAAGAVLEGGETLEADAVLVACGGASYPATGSSGDGFRLAAQAGHTVTSLRPSLVPLVAQGDDCREMMGLSLRNTGLSLWDAEKKKEIYRDFGELLFTHFGLSGPVILSASSHMRHMEPGRYQVRLDLKPALRPEQLDARLQRDFAENRNRDFANSLGALLPRKLIPVAVRRSGIPPETKCNAITREMRWQLGALLKQFTFSIQGFRPLEEAIVTSGGVSVRELNPKTMESKLVPGLYFAGEVVDVDAYTGGFNLQIAFSTGRAAAQAAAAGAPNHIEEG